MKALGKWKKTILILSDAVLINLAYILAFYLRYNYRDFKLYSNNYKEIALVVIGIYIACFYILKLYESLWSYASIYKFMLVTCGCLVSNIDTIVLVRIFGHGFDFGVSIIACVFSIIFIGVSRMSFQIYSIFEKIINCNVSKNERKKVMIIGTKSAVAMGIKQK